jgi:outer membrane protein assembly factor BamB
VSHFGYFFFFFFFFHKNSFFFLVFPKNSGASRRLVVLYTNSVRRKLYGMHFSNGSLIWDHYQILGRPPALLARGIVVGAENSNIHVFDASDGTPALPTFVHPAASFVSPPVFGPGGAAEAYIGANNTLWRIDLTAGTVTWASTVDFGDNKYLTPTVTARGEVVFHRKDGPEVHALDTATGALLWSLDAAAPVRSSPTMTANGTCIVTAGPSMAPGVIMLFNVSQAQAQSPEGPQLLWNVSFPGDDQTPTAQVSVSEDGASIFVACYSGVVAFDATDGSIIWFTTDLSLGSARATPSISLDGRFVASGLGNHVLILNATNGAIVASTSTQVWGALLSSPAWAADGSLVAAPLKGVMHIVPYPIIYISTGPAVAVEELATRVEIVVANGDASRANTSFLINVTVTAGSASPRGVDYSAPAGSVSLNDGTLDTVTTLSFAHGEFEKAVVIPITFDDFYAEGNETFTVSLSGLRQLSGPEPAHLAESSTSTVVTIVNTASVYADTPWPMARGGRRGDASVVPGGSQAGFGGFFCCVFF